MATAPRISRTTARTKAQHFRSPMKTLATARKNSKKVASIHATRMGISISSPRANNNMINNALKDQVKVLAGTINLWERSIQATPTRTANCRSVALNSEQA